MEVPVRIPVLLEGVARRAPGRVVFTGPGKRDEERLDAAGFFFPETKVAGVKANLRNMWGRLGLTRAEVQTFHGMLRQIAFKLKNQGE